ncbi:MAG: hypothetical protein IJ139_03935 [Bacteroidaceae bacterium]|jgi:hypothetical protein|nr:hypothetical protein [Bacteroidaceae bacterium]MBQ9175999.1 hypothetical protein [Bacteroidaceae bacterium]MBR1379752.1 hypothetical protein [Bacteroidaceae bacterium]
MKANKDILTHCNKANPFVVPEGYFDTLTARVMANIPAEETKVISIAPSKKTYWKSWVGVAAACIAGTIICVNVLNNKTTDISQPQLISNAQPANYEETYDDAYKQEVLNYAMVDLGDVYNYMSGNAY